MSNLKRLTVVSIKGVHCVRITRIETEGHFIKAYLEDKLVAGFSVEAIDEFYVTDWSEA